MNNPNLVLVEATIYDNISEANGRQEVLIALRNQAAEIAALREVETWAYNYIHADTNEKDTQAFRAMKKAVEAYRAARALKGAK